MKRVYFIPNIITALGLACGLFVIFKVNMVTSGSDGVPEMYLAPVLLLIIAAFADLLDGAVARAMRAESEFGVIFDSLADAVSFGVAPSVLFLKNLSLEPGTGLSFLATAGAMMFSLCGVLRLVRYNVLANEVKEDPESLMAHKKHFTGLPIPAAALGFAAINLFFSSKAAGEIFLIPQEQKALILTCAAFLLGYLMVSRLKFPSSKALHFKLPSFHLMFFTGILAICLFYGVFYFFPLIFLALTWGYIFVALTLSLIRVIAGRKSKTLEDFEPDEEE